MIICCPLLFRFPSGHPSVPHSELYILCFSSYFLTTSNECCPYAHACGTVLMPMRVGPSNRVWAYLPLPCLQRKLMISFFQQPSAATGSSTRGGVSWHPPSSTLECDWLGFVQATTTAPVQLCSSLVCLKDSNLQNSSLSQALPFFMTLFSQCLLSFVDKAVLL